MDVFFLLCAREKSELSLAQDFVGGGFVAHGLSSVNIHAHDDYAFRIACRFGRLEVAQWLWSMGGVDVHVLAEAFVVASRSGNLSLVNWLHDEILGSVDDFALERGFVSACRSGNIDLVAWFLAKLTPFSLVVTPGAVIAACASGPNAYHLVLWLVEVYPAYRESLMRNSTAALMNAARSGSLDLVKWLAQNDDPTSMSFRYLLSSACAGGNMDLVQWIYDACDHSIAPSFSPILTFMHICEYGHLNVCTWLFDTFGRDVWDFKTDPHMIRAYARSIASGNPELQLWMEGLGAGIPQDMLTLVDCLPEDYTCILAHCMPLEH